MTQRKTGPSKDLHHDGVNIGKPGSPPPRARDVIKERFKKPRELITIEREDTVLFDENDAARGATPFINLMAALVDDKGPNTEPFAAKWLVRDATQIKHVLAAAKAHSKSLFDTITRHATVAVISESSKHKETLAEAIPASSQTNHRVLTAFPTDAGDGYDYYGHVEPLVDQSWADGPRSIPLDNVSNEVDNLLKKLHLAHIQILSGTKTDTVKDLEKSGISVVSLEQLIK